MIKELDNKNYLVIGYSIISLISLFIFYISFLSLASEVSADEISSIKSLQNVIFQIHKEDSNLYRILLSEKILSSEISNFKSVNDNLVISNLINLKSSELFTSVKLASTIDDYYSITNIRLEIIELYQNEGTSKKINELLLLYEKSIEVILSDVKNEIKYITEVRAKYQKKILVKFIVFEAVLLALFLGLYFRYSYRDNSGFDSENKTNEIKVSVEINEDMIMDSDCRKILEFIGSETSKGNFPTFKDLKAHLGLSHPTVLGKVNDLQARSLVGIRKQGRNKHLFLR
jgi:hypothetical protein